MKRLNSISLIALGLIGSALTVHTAQAQAVAVQAAKSTSIKISSLPFTITTPGTYVLTGNLTYPNNGSGAAINIQTAALTKAVVLDLKGFTITYGGQDYTVCVYVQGGTNTRSITIRNGTITNFGYGVYANPTVSASHFASIVVDNLTLVNSFATGVEFGFVSNSVITNCTFLGGKWGIYDYSSQGGNRYINNNFDGNQSQAQVVILGSNPLTLEDCHLEASQ